MTFPVSYLIFKLCPGLFAAQIFIHSLFIFMASDTDFSARSILVKELMAFGGRAKFSMLFNRAASSCWVLPICFKIAWPPGVCQLLIHVE